MRRFGLSQPVPRSEDQRFLTGTGRYTADFSLPGQAHAVVLRSMHAHAEIAGIDAEAALAMPGVLAVITANDLAAAGLGEIPCAVTVRNEAGETMPSPGRPLLASGRVRFVGEPVAFIIAETRADALNAAEALFIDYRPLSAVATIEDAIAEDAIAEDATAGPAPGDIWPGAPGNLAFFWSRGDEAAVTTTIAAAAHVVRLTLVNNRVIPCPMEARAAIGAFDAATGAYTLITSSQGAHQIRDHLCQHTLKVPAEKLRVIVPDVGGGFGTKIFHYPEEALVLWAAARLGRPVRWIADRMEAFQGDTHGRDQRNHIVAAFTQDGTLQALRVDTLANMGAYLNEFAPAIPSQMTGCMLSGSYAIGQIFATCRGVYTNTVPIDAYRGAGRPEAAYLVERLMDAAAHTLGLAVDEIRRRNFIRPEQMPYHTAAGPTYDSGNFARNLDDALAAADWNGFENRRQEARARGYLRGRGLSSYVEICGFDAEEATLRCGDDGTIELLIGTQSTGQGHQTAYAQIICEDLGVPFEAIRVTQGDTGRIPFGNGTSGSRSLPVGGPAVRAACAALIERGREHAARLLQATQDAIVFAGGRFTVFGSERGIGLLELTAAVNAPENRTAVEGESALQASGRFELAASTFPNGTHVCEVEIEPDTGRVQVVTYHVVDDFGRVVNPLLLAGQVHGGIAQGIGQALFERAIFDRETGQLLSGSFVDYALPRAHDIPPIDFRYNQVPCTTNPMGIKGAGEAGTIGACAAVVNAAIDALSELGVRHVDMPLTPETIWRAIANARC
ncbi:MAG: xanthine dehydrogenase family protein molybdopterin-binding subunit [Rhodospirillales bacterium]|nr:xanthine dehydrogenase family protein molybdopterin-binding subunit [Rhodospirillales bacterium]